MSTIRDQNLNVSVSDAGARYSGSDIGMTVDAGVQGGDGNSVYVEGIEPLGGHHGASELLPELRNSLRSTDEVERDRQRGRHRSAWFLPMALGLGTFLLILAASPVVVWLALSAGPEPVAKPPPPPQDDLMGIPVRRGLK